VELGAVPTEPRLHADSLVLPSLVTRCRQRGVALCTSEESLAEIDRLAPHRPDIRDRLRLAVAAVEVLPVPSDRAVSHALVAAVESFLLAKTRVRNPRKRAALRRDALHLTAAVEGGCDVFLTTDYASIWAYRRGLQRLLDLRVLRPVELAALV
jgi:predicted nucleic acid-binding protein